MKIKPILCAVFLGLASCQTKVQTFIPDPIVESQPSWDGDKQNSGLISFIEGKGFLITPSAAERYTALTIKWGSQLTPPITEGEGLVVHEGNYLLSPQYMAVFMALSRLNKL